MFNLRFAISLWKKGAGVQLSAALPGALASVRSASEQRRGGLHPGGPLSLTAVGSWCVSPPHPCGILPGAGLSPGPRSDISSTAKHSLEWPTQ
jgi:hypothetical protein